MRGLVAVVLSIAFEFVALGMPARATDTLPMNFILRFEASAESLSGEQKAPRLRGLGEISRFAGLIIQTYRIQ